MYTLWKLTIASIKMFVRNRQALFFTFFTPLIIMVIFGVIGFDQAPKIRVGVAFQGSLTEQAQQFIGQLRSVPVFEISVASESAQRRELEEGNRSAVIILNTGMPNQLTILTNVADPNAQTTVSLVSQMLDRAAMAAARTPALVTLNVEEVNVHNLRYIDFLVPGLVAMAVMQLAVFSVAFVFVEYKEKGILKRILATPVKPFQFVFANIITRLIVALIQAAFFVAIGVLLFNVTVVGSYWLMSLIVMLGAIMFIGLGFAISGVSKTTDSVPAIANLVVFPMLFLGGAFFAIDSMPSWLQIIAKLLPLTHFSTAMRDVMTKGASLSDISANVLWMFVWAVILVFLAILTFRFEQKRGA